MTDDKELIASLRGKEFSFMEKAADRIEELEAKIADAKYFLEMCPAYSNADCRTLIKKALAKLKG